METVISPVMFAFKSRLINYLLTQLFQVVLGNIVFVQTSLHSVHTVTTSGQYPPVRPSRLVNNCLVFTCTVHTSIIFPITPEPKCNPAWKHTYGKQDSSDLSIAASLTHSRSKPIKEGVGICTVNRVNRIFQHVQCQRCQRVQVCTDGAN